MRKWIFLVVFIVILLMGCAKDELLEGKPPKTILEIGYETYETVIGTYCWKNMCVDTTGPIELLEGKAPIKVELGETIVFKMDYNPKPTECHLVQIQEGEETEIIVQENQFTAPTEKGIYYYAYTVWWMDDKEENMSHGDAFYAFALEVTEPLSESGLVGKMDHREKIPTLSLTVGAQEISAVRGTYEWHYLDRDGTMTGVQADAVTPAELVERQTKTTVTPMTDIHLNFDSSPEDYDIQIWNFDNEVIGESDEIELFGQKGDIIIAVIAHWPEGTVSYAVPFHIE